MDRCRACKPRAQPGPAARLVEYSQGRTHVSGWMPSPHRRQSVLLNPIQYKYRKVSQTSVHLLPVRSSQNGGQRSFRSECWKPFIARCDAIGTRGAGIIAGPDVISTGQTIAECPVLPKLWDRP